MSNHAELNNLYEVFEWSSNAIAVISNNKIIYINRALATLFPFIRIDSPSCRLIPDEIISSAAAEGGGHTIENFVIDNCVCTVRISNVHDVSVITLSDVINSQLTAESLSSLCNWLQCECINLKDPLFTISSALTFVINSLPDDLYPKFSDYLASINQNSYKTQKILNNIAYITNSLNTADDRTIADISSLCKSFVNSFHTFFKPHSINLSATLPDEKVLAHCNISEIRHAIYNILDFFVDGIPSGGEITLSLCEEDNLAVMLFSIDSSNINRQQIFKACEGRHESRLSFAKNAAERHNGSLTPATDLNGIRFAIDRDLTYSGYIRTSETEYDQGNYEFLTEFSDVLPLDFYRIK